MVIIFSSCNSEATKTETAAGFSLDSAKAAIAASNKVFGGCFASGDSTTFANCYTSDACLNVTNMPRMCGTQAIIGFFNGGRKMGINNIVITPPEIKVIIPIPRRTYRVTKPNREIINMLSNIDTIIFRFNL